MTATLYDAFRYQVQSDSDPTKVYMVDLIGQTCDCPHFRCRLAGTGQFCKHFESAEAQCGRDFATAERERQRNDPKEQRAVNGP